MFNPEVVDNHTAQRKFYSTGWSESCETCREYSPDGYVEFTWKACDSCKSHLGGSRHFAHYFDDDDVLCHEEICCDCVIYIANGEVPHED